MNKIFCTVLGVAIGGTAGWFASKYYYDKKAKVMIATGEDFAKADISNEEKPEEKKKEEPANGINTMSHEDIKQLYSQVLGKKNYGNPESEKDLSPTEGPSEEPYIITAAEWGEANGYDKVELVYFNGDGVVATYDDEVYDDFEALGNKYVSVLTEGEEDVVYIRNESYSRDFEITLDGRAFEDVASGR